VVDGLAPKPLPPLQEPTPAEPDSVPSDSSAYPTIKFFVKDHLGNVRVAYKTNINDTTCLVDRKVVAVMDYSPYGGLLRAWFEGDPEKWQSTGHERDLESGWDFRGARLYDASYGRFLSRDPLGGMYPGWSPYNYVLGNPVSLTDPTGMSAEGGGKDGKQYELIDGDPNINLDEVQIRDFAPKKHWTQTVVENYQKYDYFSIDVTQRGKGSGMCTINWSTEKAIIVLDVIGMSEIPGLSQMADFASAAISAYQGDALSTGFSMAAALPIIGNFATAGKWANKGRKALKHADEAVDAVTGAGKTLPTIRNKHLAGGVHPKTGVPFDADGFPDFSAHLYSGGVNDVIITPGINRAADFAAANKAAGYAETPAGFSWHHHQVTGRMQLVERKVHRDTGHTGWWSLYQP
jgi:RHS repeat-associated protein